MDGFTETISRSTGIACPSIVSEVWVYILISLEKYSVFRAFHLFIFAAKKQIKCSKIRTAESSGI